jgi:hypothetical protein
MSTPAPAWDIALATDVAADAAAAVAAAELDMALIEAVLADQYRDAGIAPLDPAQLGVVTAGMTSADWQRLSVIVALLKEAQLRAALPGVSQRMHVRDQIEALVAVTQDLAIVELRALAASVVRAEELARRVASALRVEIAGETRAESDQRLAKINYRRLLANVDTAKASAQEQMAELLRRQEAEDQGTATRRRGKW